MKTTEEKTAVQVAQEIPCACYDCGINGLKATEMIQAYADQQVNKAIQNCIEVLINDQDILWNGSDVLGKLESLKIKQP